MASISARRSNNFMPNGMDRNFKRFANFRARSPIECFVASIAIQREETTIARGTTTRLPAVAGSHLASSLVPHNQRHSHCPELALHATACFVEHPFHVLARRRYYPASRGVDCTATPRTGLAHWT